MFLHTYHSSPILIQVGPVSIYWYGLLVVIAILAGFFICLKLGKRLGLSKEHFWNLLFPGILAGLIGARLYHVFCELPYYWQNPAEILKIWQGGVGIFGAIAGGILVFFWYSRKYKISFWNLADIVFIALPLGQAIVRWGNYFNQELFGLPTTLAWGIPIDFANRPLAYISFQYFHPVFLYESIWNLIVFIILLLLFRKLTVGFTTSNSLIPGTIFLTYFILYSLGRFFISFLRIDPQPFIFGLRMDQFICLLFIIISTVILLWRSKK